LVTEYTKETWPMSKRSRLIRSGVLAATFFIAACPGREVAEVPPEPNPVPDKKIPVQINRNVDILFVIDDSGSMREEQDSLLDNFGNFIGVLQNIEGGLPNVHIGVISTNVGAVDGVSLCGGTGDDGVLKTAAALDGDRFIVDVEDGGGGRTTNYAGSLTEAFADLANLGIEGCGFEAPLESMRLALNGSKSENAGFLRDDAFLAVIFITDEDDCSVRDRQAFFGDPQAGVNDPLGPFSSFRCFEFGIQCSGDDPRSFGSKDECIPRANSPYLYDVQEYIDVLKEVKDQNLIIVGGISGPAELSASGSGFRTSVQAKPDEPQQGIPELAPSCEATGLGEADPAIRLNQFITSFRENVSTSICEDDLSDPLQRIADLLAEVIGTPCLSANVSMPPDCVGWLEDRDGNNQELVPECGNPPCYRFLDPSAVPQCNGTFGVEFDPGDTTQAPFTNFRLQCVGDVE
jgi:hypothetical protein